MPLFLEITSGEKNGSKYLIKEGITLGRSKADINPGDKKMSGEHAKIVQLGRDWILKDLNSTNGTFFNGQRITELTLSKGIEFQAGRTVFKVVELSEKQALSLGLATDQEIQWRSLLINEVPKLISADNEKRTPVVFKVPLVLKIKSGIQAGEKYVLGWGPRVFGSETLDCLIIDAKAIGQTFTIKPDGINAVFETRLPEIVSINDRALYKEVLKEGDLIRVGETTIQVSFGK